MKRLALIALWPALAFAQETDPRLNYGGKTPTELYRQETAIYRGMDMYFEGTLADLPVVIQYSFEYDKDGNQHVLRQAVFFPMTQYDDTTRYYQDALKVAEYENAIYGQPDAAEETTLTWEEPQADIRLLYNLPAWQLWYDYKEETDENTTVHPE